jgi:hypothetical protein
VEAALEEDLLDWGRGLDELPALGDAQVALSLLRQCAAARPRYLLRTLEPTSGVLDVYNRFDLRLRSVVAALLEGAPATSAPAASPSWTHQAVLPIKWGGLGLGDLALSRLSELLDAGCTAP